MSNGKRLTTAAGTPVPDNQNSLSAGGNGPTLMQDVHLLEKLAHFNREKIPERIVHAKGAGAYGYFEVTDDLSCYTRAKFLAEVGKQTEVFVRFSTVGGEKGSADAERDPRGFALKFYTEEGNYDLVMNNTPVFFIRDAMKFPDFIHTQKRHPATHCKDPNMVWDFFSLSPESLHQVTVLFSDRGTPRTYRHMDGFSGHTFSWYNEQGEAVWVRYHFKTEQGIENFTREEATRMKGEDPDHATRDLYETIAAGGEAAWKVYVQIMPLTEADRYRFDPFDITKVWRHGDYPLQPLGRLVLNRNPRDFFAEVEQAAFAPSNVVPGIGFSPDKMLQGRIFAYADAHRYRLGVNHGLLPVNCPHAAEANTYQRDGAMRFDGNGGGSVNYEPNSLDGPRQASEFSEPPLEVSGAIERTPRSPRAGDDFEQPGMLYRLMPEDQQARLVDNIVDHMKPVRREIQARQITLFFKADPDYGRRVAEGLGIDIEDVLGKG